MANLPEQDLWEPGIYQIETTDPVVGGAGGIANLQATQLANRVVHLNGRLTQAEADIAAFDTAAIAQMQSDITQLRTDVDAAAVEADSNRMKRHQEGIEKIYNQGVMWGCDITVSATATRNINLAEGQVFALGGKIHVSKQDNAGAVPDNTGAQDQTVYAYVDMVGQELALTVTPIGQQVPAGALMLATIIIPAGNTEANDPYLANITIIPSARVEPDWPVLQTTAAFADVILPIQLPGIGYEVTFDLLNWQGGERPRVRAPLSMRTATGFRIEVYGSADDIDLRWLVHMMSA